MPYRSTESLQATIEALRSPRPQTSYASGLAQGIRGLGASRKEGQLEDIQSENDRIKQQEMQMLLNALTGAQAPMQPGKTPNFQHPETQALALADAMKRGQMTQEAALKGQAGPEYGLTPFYARNPESGQMQAFQLGKDGGIIPVQLPEGLEPVADSGRLSYNPTNIYERGAADTGVAIDRTRQVGEVENRLAAERQQSVGDIEIEQALSEQERMAEQERQQELDATRTQAWARTSQKEDQTRMLNNQIEQAKDQAGLWTTGLLGAGIGVIAGTPAYDLRKRLDTIRANIGFDRLQEMRENSPTGGALGQVSEMENRLLQAVWGNLEASQSEEQFRENLDLVQEQVNRSWDRVSKAYEETYGEPYFQPNQPDDNDIFRQADAIINVQ